MWKQVRVIVAQKGQAERFMTVKKGVNDQCHADDLTVAKGRGWPAMAPGAIMPLQGLVGIIDEHIPNRPSIRSMSSIEDAIVAGYCQLLQPRISVRVMS